MQNEVTQEIREFVAALPPAQREACEELAEVIRLAVRNAGQPAGPLAIALVGAEMSEEEERNA